MRKPIGIAAVAVAAVAAVCTAGITSARANTPGGSSGRWPGTFTVVERAVTDTTTDTGVVGDSVGDVLTFANPIYNAANTAQVGTDNGSCLRTKVASAYECAWTLTIDGGSLMVQGPFYDAADSLLAITGGTGKFSTARGQMKLHARDTAGSAYDFTYTVSR